MSLSRSVRGVCLGSVLSLFVALSVGCAGGRSPSTPASRTPAGAAEAAAIPHFEERALLLLLVDRQTYEPLVVRRSLAGPPDLREELAVALGRAGDPRGLDPLLGLLLDDDPAVRRSAAFALGELGEGFGPSRIEQRRRAAAGLLDAVADPDGRVGELAVEGLGKLGVTVGQVTPRMAELTEDERLVRLLPSLHRFPDPETPELARRGLERFRAEAPADRREVSGELTLAEWAVYALAREPRPESLATLRELATDPPSPRAAGWTARALGRVGEDAGDLALLRPLLDAGEPETVIHALRAARALIASGRAAPPASWRERLLELLDDPRPGVRLTAIDGASAWLLDERLGDLLAERSQGADHPVERGAAVVALATGGDPRAEELAASAARSPDTRLRARAAEAAGILGADPILGSLEEDPEPRVRQAVLAVRLAGLASAGRTGAVRDALEDPDPGVRTAALEWLADHPELPVGTLVDLLERALASRVPEERLALVEALSARGAADAAVPSEQNERELAGGALLELASRAGYAIRQRAADALESLGQPRPAVGTAGTGRTVAVYRRIVVATREERTVEIRTEHGPIRARLACPRAPLTCHNFLGLAEQGFYDGLTFHRVVPAFVIQGGDPRGDGRGGPGYTVRDEIGRMEFRAGVLGMALAGPDTGGSQFFITRTIQPHLDGDYTAFGEVVEGREVLGRILPGDRIVGIREVVSAQ